MKICLSCEGVSNTAASRCGHCGSWLLPTDAAHYPTRRGEHDAANPLVGTVIDGKYRLLGVLGRGGLGTVFRAQHVGSLMTVALKLLHPRFSERPEYRRALVPEARRAAAVTNDRCARLLDVGEAEDGVAWLAMELVEGKTLDVVARGGALQPSHAVEILTQVAQALAAIHGAGLVHCDLSPRNVMVAARDGELRVKVLDFGIARSVSLAGAARTHGEFAGFLNPAFAAPELVGGREVGPRADLFSFGVLAWLLLTGTMPVDDSDPRRAAAAVAAGELRPWPATPGVPRRLARLVQRCVQHEPAARPPSAAAVLRELAIVRGARRPLIARIGAMACGLGVVLVLAGDRAAPVPFLRPLSGSVPVLDSGPLAAGQETQVLTSSRLATMTFDYGGFAPSRLRADVVRDGVEPMRTHLRPEIDRQSGTLLLTTAMPDWRDVVEGLARASREGPVDLVFVVPGAAPLGSARVRIDDAPPQVAVRVTPAADRLLAATTLVYRVTDDIDLAAVAVVVAFRDGARHEFALPAEPSAAEREFALGEALARKLASVALHGEGTVHVQATDRADNRTVSAAWAFAAADVAAPAVVEATGPLGESFLATVDGTVRMRVRLSAAEAGATLAVACGDATAQVPLPASATTPTVELALGPRATSATWQFVVTDAAGNRSRRDLPIVLRIRDQRVEFDTTGALARQLGDELVATAGGAIVARFQPNWTIDDVRVELASAPAPQFGALRWERLDTSAARVHLDGLPPGGHVLRFALHEAGAGAGDEHGLPAVPNVPLRILPRTIEVRVPTARAPWLPALFDAGVLAPRGVGLVEGQGWGLDASLRPYLRGSLAIGGSTSVAQPFVGTADPHEPLLPVTVPVPGLNRMALRLVDVLERPVRVTVGDGAAVDAASPVTIAEFRWTSASPRMVGEELLGEFGRPMRVELRCPLPFAAADAAQLLLGIAQSEFAASHVANAGGDESVLSFEVPFAVWSVAAKVNQRTREEFAAGVEGRMDVSLRTPAGQFPSQSLRLRTVRSTLSPLRLDDLGALPPPLGALRFLPLLAPPGAFAEPVPAAAPPRATFRPQVAVAVRNMGDILLQERELDCGDVRALVARLADFRAEELARCVHHDDPRRATRMTAANLLPSAIARAPDDATLRGVDWFQAWSFARLLGLVVARDPDAFRLPFGCELELAAFGSAPPTACHGPASRGGSVAVARFLAQGVGTASPWPTAAATRAAGDEVPTASGETFVGLDFGVREWVLDLPHVAGADSVIADWIGDREVHLGKVLAQAAGRSGSDPFGPLRQFGVVRGLPFGCRAGLLDREGAPLDVTGLVSLPRTVPGVLRSEQLRRDGGDLLAGAVDPRLATVGMRLVAVQERLVALRGRR